MKSLWSLGISAIAVVILNSCMIGPNYRRPEAAVSPTWIESGDKRVKSAATDYRNWWQAFNDPVLNRLIDRAYRENLSLKVAGMRVLETRAQLGIAAGNFFPQTQQAVGSLQHSRTSESSAQSTSFVPLRATEDQVQLSAGWELDFWGRFRRAIESADATFLATVADYDNALVSLTANVANSYIAIRTLEAQLRITRDSVQAQQENLKITEVKAQYGTGSQRDVEQARASLSDTLASIPSLEAQLRQAKYALSILLGLPPGDLADFLKYSSGIPAAPAQVVVGIPADLLRRRPDIRSAEYQAAAQCAQIGVAKADLYPAFSLSGMFGFLSSDIGQANLVNIFQWQNRTYQAGPSFQWNIFNYGRIANNVRLQDARFQELLITYQNTVLQAQQDVENNLTAFLKAQERAGLLAQSVSSAKSALDLSVLQYREGITDFTTVLTAQQALLNEQNNLAGTLGTIAGNLVGVYRALGGGWEIRQGQDLISPEIKEEMEKRTDWGSLLAPAAYNPPLFEKPSTAIRPPDW